MNRGKGVNKIDTILFDVGWPIIDETEAHRAWNQHLRKRISEIRNKGVSEVVVSMYESQAVECYAPSMFSYVIWHLVHPDKEAFYMLRSEFDNFDFFKYYSIQPDAAEILSRLHGTFKLGLAANQPQRALDYLDSNGILKYFDSARVSDEIGYSKPDVRMFLRVLESLGSRPEQSVMVGDRQDNDIVPAKQIGMTAIRLLVGPHRDQKVRYPKENPDYTINKLPDILILPFVSEKLK